MNTILSFPKRHPILTAALLIVAILLFASAAADPVASPSPTPSAALFEEISPTDVVIDRSVYEGGRMAEVGEALRVKHGGEQYARILVYTDRMAIALRDRLDDLTVEEQRRYDEALVGKYLKNEASQAHEFEVLTAGKWTTTRY